MTNPITFKSAVLVGTIVNYAGQIISKPSTNNFGVNPEAMGWMLCDGRSLNVDAYPELFMALGYQYGGEDGKFNIPNLNGADDKAFPKGVVIHYLIKYAY